MSENAWYAEYHVVTKNRLDFGTWETASERVRGCHGNRNILEYNVDVKNRLEHGICENRVHGQEVTIATITPLQK